MKYIINTDDLYGGDIYKSMLLMGTNGKGEVIVQKFNLDELEELTADYINEHYGDLQDTAYQRGLEDGKAQAERGCEGCMYQDKTIEHHPCGVCCNAYNNRWTAKDDKIEVGDEVKWEGVNFTVLRVFTPKGCYEQCDGFDCDGNGYTNILTKDVTKTNRHFDIQKILEEMKG